MSNIDRQKLLILTEAQVLGLHIGNVVDVGPDGTTDAVAGALVGLVGGTLRTKSLQIFVFATATTHHVYVQPFDGIWPMPGEHHMWLSGAWPSTTAFGEHLEWTAYKNRELSKQLERRFHPSIKGLQWRWTVGMGAVEYPWYLQSRPAGAGYTHLTMAALGGGSGAVEQRVGVAEFHHVAQVVAAGLTADPLLPEQQFMFPVQYPSVLAAVSQGLLAPTRAAAQQPQDYSRTLNESLPHLAAPQLYVGAQLPPQLDAAIRHEVLTPATAGWPILAFADARLGGAGPSGVVFTGTHAFVRDGEARMYFAWSDLIAVDPAGIGDDELGVHVAGLGQLRLPVGPAAHALAPALQRIAA